jgi:flagellar biosynthesis chaperone FliJ
MYCDEEHVVMYIEELQQDIEDLQSQINQQHEDHQKCLLKLETTQKENEILREDYKKIVRVFHNMELSYDILNELHRNHILRDTSEF